MGTMTIAKGINNGLRAAMERDPKVVLMGEDIGKLGGVFRITDGLFSAYGEKRWLEVGLALASSPSLLLLDEPLAGMSPSERVETVALLKSIAQGRTMIIIDHDMDALFELAERITVLQEGKLLVEGTPEEIKGNAQVQEAYLGGIHEAIAS